MRNKLAVILAVTLALGMMSACAGKTGAEKADTEKTGTEKTKGDSSDDQKEKAAKGADAETEEIKKDTRDIDTAESEENILEKTVEEYLGKMTVEEKAAQLFIVLPEALMKDAGTVTAAGEVTQKAISQTPVGGFIYLENNLNSHDQVKTMLENVQTYSMDRMNLPMFLCVDEEGGAVARIAKSGKFDVPRMDDMSVIGARGDADEAFEAGETIGAYLSDMGFNVDFAPVADVLTNPENQVVKKRSFGSDPAVVTSMASAVARGLEEQNICAVYKHFPGHGGTAADTHEGYAYIDKSMEELLAQELVPFQAAIDGDAKVIMVGHISLPDVTGDDTPASMSREIITDILRTKMQYDGAVVTDALNMGAVTEQYSSAEAAVQTILAGGDLVLMPENFDEAYQGVLAAVESGTISEERLDESLRRILKIKISMMKE